MAGTRRKYACSRHDQHDFCQEIAHFRNVGIAAGVRILGGRTVSFWATTVTKQARRLEILGLCAASNDGPGRGYAWDTGRSRSRRVAALPPLVHALPLTTSGSGHEEVVAVSQGVVGSGGHAGRGGRVRRPDATAVAGGRRCDLRDRRPGRLGRQQRRQQRRRIDGRRQRVRRAGRVRRHLLGRSAAHLPDPDRARRLERDRQRLLYDAAEPERRARLPPVSPGRRVPLRR